MKNGHGRLELKGQVHRQLLAMLDLNEARAMEADQLHHECSRRLETLLSEQGIPLSAGEKGQLLREVMDEIFGLGPLEVFLRALVVMPRFGGQRGDPTTRINGYIRLQRDGLILRCAPDKEATAVLIEVVGLRHQIERRVVPGALTLTESAPQPV